MASFTDLPGDWGPDQWSDPSGTAANNGPQVQTNSVLVGSTQSESQNGWTGFFQDAFKSGMSYLVQRDAAKSGLTPARAANGQPVYVAASQAPVIGPGGMTTNGMLLIGAAIVGALLLVKSKG